jgi:hypothetical protein
MATLRIIKNNTNKGADRAKTYDQEKVGKLLEADWKF